MSVKITPKKPVQTKSETILKHMSHKNGASLVALEKATGWQSHSIRAALAGLRKKGHRIEHSKDTKGVTIYKVVKL